MSLHSPEILSTMSFEKAAGFSLNFCLQFFSNDSKASRTLSGFSNLVSAARMRNCFDSAISASRVDAVFVEARKSAEDDDDGAVASTLRRLMEVADECGVENAPTEATPSRAKEERNIRAMMPR